MSLLPGARQFRPGNNEPPKSYTPGSGRGATPITTRADFGIHSIGKMDQFGMPPPGYIPGKGRGATGFAGGVSRDEVATGTTTAESDNNDLSDSNFDSFHGYNEALFRNTEYDDDDREADDIYDAIDQRMDQRRKKQRERELQKEMLEASKKSTIQSQFHAAKRALSTISLDEWESIPAVADSSLKKNKKQIVHYTPAPDTLLINSTPNITELNAQTPIGLGITTPIALKTTLNTGIRTSVNVHTSSTDGNRTPSLNDLGEARGTVLSARLDKMLDSVTGQTTVDPKGYLTNLNLQGQGFDMGDTKKARLLLKSVTTTNAKHSPGWIAAARLEELEGKMDAAREIIAQGCINCPESEDVWLEAARLETPEAAKAILAKAVQKIPNSVKLWLDAANRENDKDNKKRILRKSLEFIPNSVKLWKEAISLEDETNAYILLKRATECVPTSVELWLALARLSSYTEAQSVLNEARKNIPTNADIWITASKLEESQGNYNMVEIIIKRALDVLSKKGVVHSRKTWIEHAENCEKSGFLKTCQAIIKMTMEIGVTDGNKKRTWKLDAQASIDSGCIETARAIYMNATEHIKTKKSIWMRWAEMEMQYGTSESVDSVLQKAVTMCPKSEVLWLMASKHKWTCGDVPGARKILATAFAYNENSEAISLAAAKLERDNNEIERTRKLLERGRNHSSTEKIWMQSIQLERQVGDYPAAIGMVNAAIEKFPKFDKLYMIAAQLIMEYNEDSNKIEHYLRIGCENCPNSGRLWLVAIDWYVTKKDYSKARATVEMSKIKMKAGIDEGSDCADLIWLYAVKIENLCGNDKNAYFTMSSALQAHPTSGYLWAEAIFLEPKASRNSKAVDALNKCNNNPLVVCAVSTLFWKENKIAKARKWFERAITLDPSDGSIWGNFMAFEIDCGSDVTQKDVINKCTQAEPTRGYFWNRVIKRVKNWKLSYPQKLYAFVREYHPTVLDKLSDPDIIKVMSIN